jgi:lipopolysaccharide cholinephosphotransferase
MSPEEIQAVLIDILSDVVSICARRQIDVFLIGGGCLGLARHGGFVPWDDDLDLSICAADLPAFLEAMKDLPPHLAIRAEPRDYDPRYSDPIYKIMDIRTRIAGDYTEDGDGIFVDIVPMRHWRSRQAKSLERRVCGWSAVDNLGTRDRSPDRVHRRLGRVAIARWAARNLLRPLFLRDDARCRARKSGIITGAFGWRWAGRFPYDVVFPLRQTSFRGVPVSVPNDLHRFLVLRYGESYMTPPDESGRWRHFTSATRVTRP